MATQTCSKCGGWLAWGLFRCPRCGELAPMYAEAARLIKKGTRTMPRITAAAGPSNAAAVEGEVGFIKREERKAERAVEKVVTEVRGEHGPEVVVDWASKSVAHLREFAKDRGLSTAGSKGDLAARLAEHEAASASAAEVAPAETEPAAADVKG